MLENESIIKAIQDIISYIGDDVARPALANTPEKCALLLKNLFSGYQYDLAFIKPELIANNHYQQKVILDDIEFYSFCEHHFLPFSGVVKISYIPDKHLIGIGQLVQIVEIYAKRLQIQERLTIEIASALDKILQPHGVLVQITAKHSCLSLTKYQNQRHSLLKTAHIIGNMKEEIN